MKHYQCDFCHTKIETDKNLKDCDKCGNKLVRIVNERELLAHLTSKSG